MLVEDRLFSTLETTVGRMEASPRVLLADTIGFIDAPPSETLEAFRATLAEALECDLLLLMANFSLIFFSFIRPTDCCFPSVSFMSFHLHSGLDINSFFYE